MKHSVDTACELEYRGWIPDTYWTDLMYLISFYLVCMLKSAVKYTHKSSERNASNCVK